MFFLAPLACFSCLNCLDLAPEWVAVSRFVPKGMGWLPDIPDARDYAPWHDNVLPLLMQLKRTEIDDLPKQVDLRENNGFTYFPPAQDQGPLNCSCACAVLSVAAYFSRRVLGDVFEGSRLFLYKVTRNWVRPRIPATGDTGASLRATLKALVQFGVPAEEYVPFDPDRFDVEPSAFHYRISERFRGVRYFRLDQPNQQGADTLAMVKSFLAAGFPIVFGFPVPFSLTDDGNIPYRPQQDSNRGGQAVAAVGYTKQSLLIRSSWGTAWGDNGFGWLPNAYVKNQLARDFWTFVNEDWLDPDELFRPAMINMAKGIKSS